MFTEHVEVGATPSPLRAFTDQYRGDTECTKINMGTWACYIYIYIYIYIRIYTYTNIHIYIYIYIYILGNDNDNAAIHPVGA